MSLSPEGKTWEQYFADLKAENQNAGTIVPAVETTVLEVDRDPSRSGLGASVRKVLEQAESWPNNYLFSTLVHHSDEFYMEDSKKKPGQEAPEHRKGDLKKAAHEKRHWWVGATFPEIQMGFQAHWTEGVTPKGGRSFSFEGARALTPLGVVVELVTDFTLGDSDTKRVKDEPEWAHQERVRRLYEQADERDRMYNDGASYLNRRPVFRGTGAAGRFAEWLAEASEIVAGATQRKEAA